MPQAWASDDRREKRLAGPEPRARSRGVSLTLLMGDIKAASACCSLPGDCISSVSFCHLEATCRPSVVKV